MPKKKKKGDIENTAPSVRELVKMMNKDLGFEALRLANEVESTFLIRRPCGIFSLDLATAGGLPAGTMCKIGGAEGLGKNYLADLYMAENQRIFGQKSKVFIVTSEYPFDKLRARDNGFEVALTKRELEQLEISLGRDLEKEERKALSSQTGEVVLIHGLTMNKALQAILRLLESNLFHIGLIDSVDSLIPEEMQDRDVGDGRVGGSSAIVMSDFMKRFHYVIGKNRKTLLLALGQARANIPRPGSMAFTRNVVNDPYAAKHAHAGKIVLSNGGPIRDSKSGPQVGKVIRWSIEKGKAGFHDGVKGELNYRYASGVDHFADFVEVAKVYMPKGGPYYSIPTSNGEVKVLGVEAMADHFRKNPNDMEYVKSWIYKEEGIAYMYDEDEETAGGQGRKKASKKGGR